MAAITHLDVDVRLGQALSESEVADVEERLIPAAESDLVVYLNRGPLAASPIIGEEHDLRYGETVVELERTPVTSVSEVRVDGSVVSSDSYVVLGWGIRLAWAPGYAAAATVAVDYVGGLGTIPDAYEAARTALALRVAREVTARRAMGATTAAGTSSAGVRSVSVEGYSVTYEGDTTLVSSSGSFADNELAVVSRWRRRVVR